MVRFSYFYSGIQGANIICTRTSRTIASLASQSLVMRSYSILFHFAVYWLFNGFFFCTLSLLSNWRFTIATNINKIWTNNFFKVLFRTARTTRKRNNHFWRPPAVILLPPIFLYQKKFSWRRYLWLPGGRRAPFVLCYPVIVLRALNKFYNIYSS